WKHKRDRHASPPRKLSRALRHCPLPACQGGGNHTRSFYQELFGSLSIPNLAAKLAEQRTARLSRRNPCFLPEKSYKPSLPLAPGRELNGRPQALERFGGHAAGPSGPASGVPAF